MPHVPQTGKSDKSQFPICDPVESERSPAHRFIGSSVGHFPCSKAHDIAFVFFLIDKKMLCGAENFVDSLVAVFADVGETLKRRKDFSDHIFSVTVFDGIDFAVSAGND